MLHRALRCGVCRCAGLGRDSGTYSGVFQSGQMEQTVNLLTSVFGGSNPSTPTKLHL